MNEVEKKEIDEMAKYIAFIFVNKCNKNGIKYETIAEDLYNAGYRKLKTNIEFKITAGDVSHIIERARNQAIKEFAEKLKDKFNDYEATSYNGYEEGWHDLQEEIDDLLKEYGIDKE